MYVKTKVKSYERRINRNVFDDKVPKEGSQYVCLSEIFIDFAFRTDKNYHPQVFLEEGKNVAKERKMPKYVIESKEISSDESDKKDSDEESSDKEDSDEEPFRNEK